MIICVLTAICISRFQEVVRGARRLGVKVLEGSLVPDLSGALCCVLWKDMLSSVGGVPKSRIMQNTTFLHMRGIQQVFDILIV